jgi:hypothetical protein
VEVGVFTKMKIVHVVCIEQQTFMGQLANKKLNGPRVSVPHVHAMPIFKIIMESYKDHEKGSREREGQN